MSKYSIVRTLAAVAIASGLVWAPSHAVTVAAPAVTGHVTAITANVSITIDGKQYAIAAGSPAATTVRGVTVGDQVGLVLDGPAAKVTTHVVSILKQSTP